MRLSGIWKWIAVVALVAVFGPSILQQLDLGEIGDAISPAPTGSRAPVPAGAAKRIAMPPCTNGRQAPSSGSCVIDGDSGWLEGRQWRMEGVDAPEIGSPECSAERQVGERAKQRLSALLGGGFTADRGGSDRYGRQLVTFRLADGRDVGSVLISERLAQKWPNRGNVWCD
jgi:endonuclease YncB( thermonuclease family)